MTNCTVQSLNTYFSIIRTYSAISIDLYYSTSLVFILFNKDVSIVSLYFTIKYHNCLTIKPFFLLSEVFCLVVYSIIHLVYFLNAEMIASLPHLGGSEWVVGVW